MSDKPLLVIRPTRRVPTAQMEQLAEQAKAIQERISTEDAPVVVITPDLHAYWLRPGDSTTEMDARADLIRAEAAAMSEREAIPA